MEGMVKPYVQQYFSRSYGALRTHREALEKVVAWMWARQHHICLEHFAQANNWAPCPRTRPPVLSHVGHQTGTLAIREALVHHAAPGKRRVALNKLDLDTGVGARDLEQIT